ncbi:MAG TPA: hypothetical protein DD420_35525, partial [Streptomyces sp.]|nr:hypothetical protein [Streptomyces sp.]
STPGTAAPGGPAAPHDAPGAKAGRIPAYPAAERAVRALSEAVKYAQWRRQAAAPGKVPEFLDETIDEHAAAARIDALLGPGS